MAFLQRTHTCGELREEHIGQTVILNGWVNTGRDQKQFVFIDLRDRYGLTQVVFEPERGEELFKQAQQVRSEWVLAIKGTVVARGGKENPKLATGKIEVQAEEIEVLNQCPTPPFIIAEKPGEEEVANEDVRLQSRYLDLRRSKLQQNFIIRHRLNKVIRDHLDEQGFLEVETPLLGRSTPEGARDYLVPSRLFPHSWYALPQSPQLYKQLLMISGFDKYFQLARCMRDEDLRADRQLEFTQLDMEMSFIEAEDIYAVIEGMIKRVFKECINHEIQVPVARLSYHDVMLKYGSDQPDLRFGMPIVELSEWAQQTTAPFFLDTISNGGKVRAINVKEVAEQHSRKKLDALTEYVKQYGAKGLSWVKVEADKLNSPIAKFLSEEAQASLRTQMEAEPGDLLLFVADEEDIVCQSLGNLRRHLGAQLKLYGPNDYSAAWIVDFPSFFWDGDENRWVANHHPFTSPRDEDIPLLEESPEKVRAKAYDLVINGYEVGGGSIRIHDRDVQSRVFNVLGMSSDQANEKFGFLLNALKNGAPPHGGIALGMERLTMILAGTTNIRDVVAFPKNQRGRDLMTGAPAAVDPTQLQELGLPPSAATPDE